MQFFVYTLVFWLGVFIGFFIGMMIARRFKRYNGMIVITDSEDKTLYSMEIGMDPTLIRHESEILLKVVTSDESSDSQLKHAL